MILINIWKPKPILEENQLFASVRLVKMPVRQVMKDFAFNTDQKTKDELKVVNQQVKAHSKDFSFSHGACGLHLLQSYSEIPGITPERMESIKTKIKNNTDSLPCLITDKALRHGYMKGLFTPEMIKQAAQSQQQSNHQLVERFKTLSGIKSCFD